MSPSSQVNPTIYAQIDEIIFFQWDPIGVSKFAPNEARDEYYGYLPEIYRLGESKKIHKLADYLYDTATKQMGLTGHSRKECLEIAQKVVELFS